MNLRQSTEMLTAYGRRTDPSTAHDAAKTVKVTYLEGKVYEAIKAAGNRGATQDELVDLLGLPSNSITPRFRPLMNKGVVFTNGQTRAGNSGKSQRVMLAADGVNVEKTVSTQATLKALEEQQARRQAMEKLMEHMQSIEGHIRAARAIADLYHADFEIDMGAGCTGGYSDGHWYGEQK